MTWIIVGIVVFIVSFIACVCFGYAAALGELSENDLREADEWVPSAKLKNLWGEGADLWTDDNDFEIFLQATKGKETDDAKS